MNSLAVNMDTTFNKGVVLSNKDKRRLEEADKRRKLQYNTNRFLRHIDDAEKMQSMERDFIESFYSNNELIQYFVEFLTYRRARCRHGGFARNKLLTEAKESI